MPFERLPVLIPPADYMKVLVGSRCRLIGLAQDVVGHGSL